MPPQDKVYLDDNGNPTTSFDSGVGKTYLDDNGNPISVTPIKSDYKPGVGEFGLKEGEYGAPGPGFFSRGKEFLQGLSGMGAELSNAIARGENPVLALPMQIAKSTAKTVSTDLSRPPDRPDSPRYISSRGDVGFPLENVPRAITDALGFNYSNIKDDILNLRLRALAGDVGPQYLLGKLTSAIGKGVLTGVVGGIGRKSGLGKPGGIFKPGEFGGMIGEARMSGMRPDIFGPGTEVPPESPTEITPGYSLGGMKALGKEPGLMGRSMTAAQARNILGVSLRDAEKNGWLQKNQYGRYILNRGEGKTPTPQVPVQPRAEVPQGPPVEQPPTTEVGEQIPYQPKPPEPSTGPPPYLQPDKNYPGGDYSPQQTEGPFRPDMRLPGGNIEDIGRRPQIPGAFDPNFTTHNRLLQWAREEVAAGRLTQEQAMDAVLSVQDTRGMEPPGEFQFPGESAQPTTPETGQPRGGAIAAPGPISGLELPFDESFSKTERPLTSDELERQSMAPTYERQRQEILARRKVPVAERAEFDRQRRIQLDIESSQAERPPVEQPPVEEPIKRDLGRQLPETLPVEVEGEDRPPARIAGIKSSERGISPVEHDETMQRGPMDYEDRNPISSDKPYLVKWDEKSSPFGSDKGELNVDINLDKWREKLKELAGHLGDVTGTPSAQQSATKKTSVIEPGGLEKIVSDLKAKLGREPKIGEIAKGIRDAKLIEKPTLPGVKKGPISARMDELAKQITADLKAKLGREPTLEELIDEANRRTTLVKAAQQQGGVDPIEIARQATADLRVSLGRMPTFDEMLKETQRIGKEQFGMNIPDPPFRPEGPYRFENQVIGAAPLDNEDFIGINSQLEQDLRNSPALKQLGVYFANTFNNALESIGRKGPNALEIVKDIRNTLHHIGFGYDDKYYGVTKLAGLPGQSLALNPMAIFTRATPDQAAAGILHTILHEMSHLPGHEHDQNFTKTLADLSQTFGARNAINAQEAFLKVIADPRDGSRYIPEIQDLLRRYNETQGRSIPSEHADLGAANFKGYSRPGGETEIPSDVGPNGTRFTPSDPIPGTNLLERGTTFESATPRKPREVVDPAQLESIKQEILEKMRYALKLNPEQKKLYAQERANRAEWAAQVKGYSNKQVYKRFGRLKGPLPKVEMDTLNLSEAKMTALNKAIFTSPMRFYDQANAWEGMNRILGGDAEGRTVPTPYQVKQLYRVFGEEWMKQLMELHGGLGFVGNSKMWRLVNPLTVSKTFMSGPDLSGALRQGLGLTGLGTFDKTQMGLYRDALVNMARSAGSHEFYKKFVEDLEQDEMYPFLKEAGVDFTEVADGPDISSHEEQYQSNIPSKIPVVGGAYRASNRGYVAMLNKLRLDTGKYLVMQADKLGLKPLQNEIFMKQLGQFINAATGRGSLGLLEKHGALLANLLYSPRLIASRFNIPYYALRMDKVVHPAMVKMGFVDASKYVQMDPFIRKQYVKTLANMAMTWATLTAMARLAVPGSTVETDPRSSDYGKWKYGNTRVDFGGGALQYIVPMAKTLSMMSKSSTTGKLENLNTGGYGKPTLFGTWLGNDRGPGFAENKLNPALTFITEALRGKTSNDQPFSKSLFASMRGGYSDLPGLQGFTHDITNDPLLQRFLPMLAGDLQDMWEEGSVPGAAVGIPAGIFGAGLQTYTRKYPARPHYMHLSLGNRQ